jgi:hypothetical protein
VTVRTNKNQSFYLRFPSFSANSGVERFSTLSFDESTAELMITQHCKQLTFTLNYLKRVWYSKELARDIFFNAYNGFLDELENLNTGNKQNNDFAIGI